MSTLPNLNLARKWRPQSFDQVIGQDISVRMLKNGLFLSKFFPVYLFAGQRGCGKTTTARIFAAAVNCAQLPEFQQNPSQPIPCLTCTSCTSMSAGNHPDFIEIDAASHTGVDNVRQIIESSSYMPLAGKKKIYLIDEAHMLSKAAFNAFLKILEEPPASVIFVLATTEVPKIPATVLSRCFQLSFPAISSPELKNHLKQICLNERVAIDDSALDLILNETEGSARDAINLLERVRFSNSAVAPRAMSDTQEVTEKTVLTVLGKISIGELITLFDLVIDQKAAQALAHLQVIEFEQRSAQILWDMIINLGRTLIWIKYGITTLGPNLQSSKTELTALAAKCSLNRLNSMLNLLWASEELFLRTNKKHIFLEMTLLQICQQVNVADLDDLIRQCQTEAIGLPISSNPQVQEQPAPTYNATAIASAPSRAVMTPPAPQPLPQPEISGLWGEFIKEVATLNDQLLHTILMQAAFAKVDEQKQLVIIALSANSAFFKDKIDATSALWLPALTKVFGPVKGFFFAPSPATALKPITPPPYQAPPMQPAPPRPAPTPLQGARPPFVKNDSWQSPSKSYEFLYIKDPAQWPKASLILKYFPGKIRKIKALDGI